ncbi:bcl-2-like protein 15 [Apteryx mantelli]|uniref:BCL2 like 15 n=2 Tax=Apteryx TaxID=8821 RepID=A0A8B9PKH9_APTOW|nr:PREDICTED: bcl-2-like protein 15 [Apteryx mantelli mantelli]XP_025933041.1 bcl-2-like protein 15 [Apteryx rowi]
MSTFEKQTEFIVKALFSDLLNEEESAYRSLEKDSGESEQSAEETPSNFDPVVIASRLRRIGDECNLDFGNSSQVVAEVLKGKIEKFGAAVVSLSRSWSNQLPELCYERAFLAASVKLTMYIAKKIPAMVRQIQLVELINGNPQVKSYIESCGGWENFDN